MKQRGSAFTPKSIAIIQNWWQYLLFGWFLASGILLAMGGTLSHTLALIGVILVIVAILSALAALVVEFEKSGRRNQAVACAVLIGILILTVSLRLVLSR